MEHVSGPPTSLYFRFQYAPPSPKKNPGYAPAVSPFPSFPILLSLLFISLPLFTFPKLSFVWFLFMFICFRFGFSSFSCCKAHDFCETEAITKCANPFHFDEAFTYNEDTKKCGEYVFVTNIAIVLLRQLFLIKLNPRNLGGGGVKLTIPPSIFLALNFCSPTDCQKLWHNCSLFVNTSFDTN